MAVREQTIDANLEEDRVFEPSQEFKAKATCSDPAIYDIASQDPEAFWASMASELDWYKPWDSVLEWDPPFAKWFAGGKLNVSYNCIDRHISTARRNKAAIIWEGENGEVRVLTYWDLYREVGKFANVLDKLGIKKGEDRKSVV